MKYSASQCYQFSYNNAEQRACVNWLRPPRCYAALLPSSIPRGRHLGALSKLKICDGGAG